MRTIKPKAPRCEYLACKRLATTRIEVANCNLCEEHFALNCVRMNCNFEKSAPKWAPTLIIP